MVMRCLGCLLTGFARTQEDPYKLVILGKDPHRCCVTRADLFFADGHVSLVTCDEEGIVRIFVYDPHGTSCLASSPSGSEKRSGLTACVDPESKSGQHLLCRTEFHGQTEYRSSLLVARRPKNGDPEIPQARLVCGTQQQRKRGLLYLASDAVPVCVC